MEQTLALGDAEALEVLGDVWSSLELVEGGGRRPSSWGGCVTWARRRWETHYNHDIQQLLHCFPAKQVNVT